MDLSGTTLAKFQGVIAGLTAGQFIEVADASRVALDASKKQLSVFDSHDVALGVINFATAQNKQFSVDASHQIYVDNVALGSGGAAVLSEEDPLSAISLLYVGYLGRSGDAAGVAYWMTQLTTGAMTWQQIAKSFADQPEAKSEYPFLAKPTADMAGAFIDKVYLNLFGHSPDAEGKAYWLSTLLKGQDVDQAILSIALGATGRDADALVNKVSVANAFATDTGDALLPYTPVVQQEANDSIASVIDDDTAATAIVGIQDFVFEQLWG